MAEKLKITLVKSPIGAVPKQKATVKALTDQDAQDGWKCQIMALSEAWSQQCGI